MSTLRNAVQRRNHKERAQPREREKWGILEKHKDYSLRAKDYNEKKARLKILRQKAAERNPDEFYFGMYSSKTYDKGQKLTSRGNHSLNHDVARLLKTQDAGYLKTMAQSTRKAREKLQREDEQRLSQPNKETLEMDINPSKPENFHDGMTDREVRKPQIQPSLDRLKSRKFSEIELGAHKQIRAMRKRRKRNQEALRSKLEMLRSRERDLLAAEHELDLQRAKMSNSVGGVNKAGLKFKVRERKR